jgi:hypothetical protein
MRPLVGGARNAGAVTVSGRGSGAISEPEPNPEALAPSKALVVVTIDPTRTVPDGQHPRALQVRRP